MKKNKMSLTTELDLTREGTAEMTRWCILIALHQSFGIGAARLNKVLARAEKRSLCCTGVRLSLA